MSILSPFRNILLAAAAVSATLAFSGLAQAQDTGKTVAVVNGEAVTEAELARAYQALPQEYQAAGLDILYPMLLEEVISRKLISSQARAAGMADQPEIKERMAQYENELLYTTYLIQQAEARVTDAEVQEAYDAWVAQLPGGDEIETSHILVETEEEAREVIQLVTDGTPFADLATERSKDTGSGANGGELGWLRRGETVEPFENAAFALQPNTFTADPIQSQFGWHVILVTDRRAIEHPSVEEVGPQFRQQLAEGHIRAIIDEAIGGATVERFDLDGNPIDPPAMTQQ